MVFVTFDTTDAQIVRPDTGLLVSCVPTKVTRLIAPITLISSNL